MRRAHFEGQARRGLEDVLTPRGFTLTPQGDIEEPEPSAVFEAKPADFARRYPGLWHFYEDLAESCIDLWVHFDAASGHVRCELEGDDLATLYHEMGREPPARLPHQVPGTIDEQLPVWAKALEDVFDLAEQPPE